MGINCIVLGFAPLKGFHIEGMPQDKSNPFLLTEVREPLPGEHTFDPHDYILSIWSNHAQKCLWRCR